VNSYNKQAYEEVKNVGRKNGLKNQCTEMKCGVNFLIDTDFDIKSSSKDISKHNVLNWQDVAGLQWLFDEEDG